MFPLSPLGTAEKKTQLPWNPAMPYKGLGFRDVQAGFASTYRIVDVPPAKG